jgi:hypothetical protein
LQVNGSFGEGWRGPSQKVFQPNKRVVMKNSIKVALAVSAVFLIGCGSTSANEDDVNRLNDNAGNTSTKPQVAKVKEMTSGSWELGSKEDLNSGTIVAGTYIVTATSSGFGCYWETVKDFDNTIESIVANGNIDPGATARVNVKKSYAGITLRGDCLAKKKN